MKNIYGIIGFVGLGMVFLIPWVFVMVENINGAILLALVGFPAIAFGSRSWSKIKLAEKEVADEAKRKAWREEQCPICKSEKKFRNRVNNVDHTSDITLESVGDGYRHTLYEVSLSWNQCEKCGWKWDHHEEQGAAIEHKTRPNNYPVFSRGLHTASELIEIYASNSDHPVMAYSRKTNG